jgi:GDP-mannose transporter
MADKKNEDFVPEGSAFDAEKQSFLGREPSSAALHRRASQQNASLAETWSKVEGSPGASILAYCISSISMTVVNKYVVSGEDWNLNFFYLAIQVHHASGPR